VHRLTKWRPVNEIGLPPFRTQGGVLCRRHSHLTASQEGKRGVSDPPPCGAPSPNDHLRRVAHARFRAQTVPLSLARRGARPSPASGCPLRAVTVSPLLAHGPRLSLHTVSSEQSQHVAQASFPRVPSIVDATGSPALADAISYGTGRLEAQVLARLYLHFSSLVGTSWVVELRGQTGGQEAGGLLSPAD
jgi:hypothetical protein